MRVAAFTKYGREAASTRQRFLQYLPHLRDAGIEVDVYPLLGDDYVRSLATAERFSRPAVAKSYLQRVGQLLRRSDWDAIWIYAELLPYLPATFEKLAFRSGKPVIYDFDDAFFLAYEGKLLLSGKIEPLLKGAAACCCGNDYLRSHAARFNDNSVVLPTVVDTDQYRPATCEAKRPLAIGWIGTPSTWDYVRPLLPMLHALCSEHDARFLVVGAGTAARADRFPGMELRDWNEGREITDVQDMDIGIMPLPDEPWARGKSGFKLVQYMACGLPVVASPVGANSTIITNGVNGLLATDSSGWRTALGRLLDDAELCARIGAEGRKRAVADYSLQSQAPRLVEVFRSAARTG